ncbi:Pr6Pr family membrane protein [Chitinophaga sp. MM2321]|uniref:Pr6Pr family membrane protein n=1 Tax=Chitinophaga sp. MM2321 TaxID=3137178 RepID=UPI0032D58987
MKAYLSVLTVLGWFALIAQFCITISSGIAPPVEIIIQYFSYFTILTNLMVAVCCTTLLLRPRSRWGDFFSRQTTRTAITVYIVIVGIIYNLILRFIWEPQGLQRVADELLHLIIPVLFLIYWFLFVPKNKLGWSDCWPWLIYPGIYIVFTFIRGSFSGFYPYPFLDVTKIGFEKALINSAGIAAVFFAVSMLFIALGKWSSKKVVSN